MSNITKAESLKLRLEEIRRSIEAENVSYGELAELRDIAASHPELFADDSLLAEWAGIPEQV